MNFFRKIWRGRISTALRKIRPEYKLPKLIIVGVLCGLIFIVYILYFLPLPEALRPVELTTTKIFDRNGELLYEVLIPDEGKKTLIPAEKMPRDLIEATIAAEDARFYQHGGIDGVAVLKALYRNIAEARIVSGGSTITQQLSRNLLGTKHKRTFLNKIKEAVYALRLERVYEKDEILEIYLNKIYYGNLAYGIESAALDYFGKHVYDLDLAEVALLAGLPQSPNSYNPFENVTAARKRQAYVLEQMLAQGFVGKEEAEAAKAEPLKFRSNIHGIKAPHFVQYVLRDLERRYGEERVHFGGLTVRTTLSLDLQQRASLLLDLKLELLKENNVGNGAILSLDPATNDVLVWVGSRDYFDEEIDGAVDMLTALRQPGSALKPFNYLAAFLKGYTPATTVSDIPTQFETETGPYTPKNYDLKFHGLVRLREALASSLNIPAVKVLEYVGVSEFIGFLRELGIDSLDAGPSHYGLALTLGGGEVRAVDLARAYSVLANYGMKKELRTIMDVRDSSGAILERNEPDEGKNVLGARGPQAAFQIIDILSDEKARVTGFGKNTILELTHPAAVKTGTTRSFKDNWTVGFTPAFLTLVWVGNADASSMENVSGITGAAPIWHTFMEDVLRGGVSWRDGKNGTFALGELEEFERPEGLTEVEICRLSGKLPTELCRERITEIFVKGTEPREYDEMHVKLRIGYDSGARNAISARVIADDCPNPPAIIDEKIFVIYPSELRRWAMGEGIEQPPTAVCSASGWSWTGRGSGIIQIAHPQNHDSFQFDPEIPAEFQKIPFRVNLRHDVVKVEWYLDGQLVGTSEEFPFTHLWQADLASYQQKIHRLEAVAILEDGEKVRSGEVGFEVVEAKSSF